MPELLPSEQLPFEIDDRFDPRLVTAHTGVPLVIELFRQVGAAQVVNAQVRLKQRQRGLTSTQLVETLIALWTAGGDRCQGLKTLRVDVALTTLLGYELPAATTVRDLLETFHVEEPPLWRIGEKTAIPEESAPWRVSGPRTGASWPLCSWRPRNEPPHWTWMRRSWKHTSTRRP
ncbi:MAG: hypothetical protein P0120_15590 [Nitrospira sp.]|nr:hypothetical protein [Nitrospira sp.]MDF0675739.1 hypothetical protein [Nitrospira sp.]